MATTKREYVFGAFILSCAALALLITSMATQMWVVSDLSPTITSNAPNGSSVYYGLFTGRYERVLLSNKYIFGITLTCLMSDNVCAWSCAETAEARESEVRDLFTNGSTQLVGCKVIDIVPVSKRMWLPMNGNDTDAFTPDKKFVNAGLWISTVVFLVFALTVTAAATVLAVLNAATNPSKTCFALDGLYFWNGTAAALDLIVLILWGSQFAITLKDNVAIADVIMGFYTSYDYASLGYSYWFVFVSLILSVSCIAVLAVRDYLLSREPPPPAFNPDIAAKDGTIFLY